MTAIVFATEEEAHPFLKLYERGRFDGIEEGDTVQDDQITVTVTGPGKIKSTLRTERLLQSERINRLIHPGACTSLSSDITPGSILAITQVYEGDRVELSAPTYPRMPLETPFEKLTGGTLVTQDHTLTQEAEQSYWQRIAELSDNTSYAIAYVSATHGVPCHVIKVVADIFSKKKPARPTPRQDVLEQLARYLNDALQILLKQPD